MERPISVTVTCWVILALAIESVIGLLSGLAEASIKEMMHSMASPMALSSAVLLGAALSAVTVILAILMLRGANWARILYLCVSVILCLCMLAFYSRVPTAVLSVAIVKATVFGFFLFRAPANQYFATPHLHDQDDIAA